ncbi:MAG: site-specific integrase [Bacteriovoracaceae bacterium]|nr:site-specific integrase [Bacteriovoracaceae bacterium]
MSVKQIGTDEKGAYYGVYTSKRIKGNKNPVPKQALLNLKGERIRSIAEGKRVEQKLKDMLAQKCVQQVQSKTPTWNDAIDMYKLQSIQNGLSDDTIKNVDICLKGITSCKWGMLKVDAINANMIREVINVDLKGKSESYRKSVLKYIRLCCKNLVDGKILDQNPAPEIKFSVGQKLEDVLSETEAKLFLQKAKEYNDELYPLWRFALLTGMRSSEIAGMTWDKVDFVNGRMKVDCQWKKATGFKDNTKTYKDRYIDISPNLLELLNELKADSVDNFVIPRYDIFIRGEAARETRKFLKMIGIKPIHFHALRASWATIMMQKGIAHIIVMKLGGWKDLKTMDRYVRLSGIEIKGALDKLDL